MKILKQQHWHILFLSLFLYGLYCVTQSDLTVLRGRLWGIKTLNWYVLAISIPIIHQWYVLLCWRSELHYKSLSNSFGKNGFKLYKVGFEMLIVSRVVSITLLAISNNETAGINPILAYILASIFLIPVVYLLYSVAKYFGGDRVIGLDHFDPEKVKKIPFVKKGIFKYTSNGMYLFGFLLIWIPGLLFQSKAALWGAFFNHAYIWVLYYFIELPDIKIIYKNENTMFILEKLKQNVFGSGDSDLELRKRTFEHIHSDLQFSSGIDISDKNLNQYLKKITLNAYKILDKDIETLKASYTEDQIFELTVTAALANGIGRVDKATELLEEVKK